MKQKTAAFLPGPGKPVNMESNFFTQLITMLNQNGLQSYTVYFIRKDIEIGDSLFVLSEIALATGRNSRSKQLRLEGKREQGEDQPPETLI
ncbi:MAG: hypothetical protein U5L72_07370 [Bacteroidales bacterium]|nr:hypothetical protein [Bacteroidales bacterium]